MSTGFDGQQRASYSFFDEVKGYKLLLRFYVLCGIIFTVWDLKSKYGGEWLRPDGGEPSRMSRTPVGLANHLDSQKNRELRASFLNAIETSRCTVCDIELIHSSTNMSLLGMLSYKLGRSVTRDGEKKRIVDDYEANKLLRQEYRKPRM
jgi:hypothetical protein